MSDTSSTDLGPLAIAQAAEPAPGPGSRVTRTVGQAGGVTVWIALWHSFGWFGADHWSATQAAERWPAIFAASITVASIVHNVSNYWLTRRKLSILSGVPGVAQETKALADIAATPGMPPPPSVPTAPVTLEPADAEPVPPTP